MFDVANGEPLGFDDPPLRGHAIEFRINAEDAGRNFLPAPGRLERWSVPAGPGVRVDAGYTVGETVPGEFDSLIAKLVVTGADRAEAIARSRRALAEFDVAGMPTVIPFHRAVLAEPDFTDDFAVHTRWIETDWLPRAQVPPYAGPAEPGAEPEGRQRLTVEVDGKRLEVSLPEGLGAAPGASTTATGRPRRAARHERRGRAGAPAGNALTSPMQGTIVKVVVEDGQQVAAGDLVVVLEAMKMEQPITAHRAGVVSKLAAEVGTTVPSGHVLALIDEPG